MTSDILAILDARLALHDNSGVTAIPVTADELRAFKVGSASTDLSDAEYRGFTLYCPGALPEAVAQQHLDALLALPADEHA